MNFAEGRRQISVDSDNKRHPSNAGHCAAETRERIANVPAIYMSAISAPAAKTARGSVRRGSRTSSLIAETSSNPVNAKAICDQKLTVSQFHEGNMLATLKWVTEPCRKQT